MRCPLSLFFPLSFCCAQPIFTCLITVQLLRYGAPEPTTTLAQHISFLILKRKEGTKATVTSSSYGTHIASPRTLTWACPFFYVHTLPGARMCVLGAGLYSIPWRWNIVSSLATTGSDRPRPYAAAQSDVRGTIAPQKSISLCPMAPWTNLLGNHEHYINKLLVSPNK